MAKFCEVCGKGIVHGNNVSHSNRNTQKVHVMLNGRAVRMCVCTRCLRSNKVERAV